VLLCPVLLLRNEPEAALEVIDHGLSIVSHNSERIFEAELYRLKARALLMRGAPDAEVESCGMAALLLGCAEQSSPEAACGAPKARGLTANAQTESS
jgi:hypothetical protein